MLEVRVLSDELRTKRRYPDYCVEIYDKFLNDGQILFKGAFLKLYNNSSSVEQDAVMKKLYENGESDIDTIILDYCALFTKLEPIQISSKESILKYLNTECIEKDSNISSEVILMIKVNEALDKIKDGGIKKYLPFNIENVVIIAQCNSELDALLSMKFKLFSDWVAPNNVKFNFYKI